MLNAEQAQPGLVESFYETEGLRDRPRGETLVEVEVVNEECNCLPIEYNNVSRGTHRIPVYASFAKTALPMMVEQDTAAVQAAKTTFAMHIGAIAARALKWPGAIDELLTRRGKGDAKIDKAFAEAEGKIGRGWQGFFHDIKQRDPQPLSSFKIIREGIAEPQRAKMAEERNEAAKMVATAVREAMQPSTSQQDVQAIVKAAVAEALAAERANKGGK